MHVGLHADIFLDEVPGQNKNEEGKLDAKLDESRGDFREGHYESREINLPEYIGVFLKRFGRRVEALLEVIPQGYTRQVKQGPWYTVGTNFRDVPEHQQVNGGGHDGLYNEPYRTKYGLLVNRYDIPLDEHVKQVAVLPDFLEVNVKCMPLGAYDKVVVFFHQYKINLSYWPDGTRMIEFYTCPFVTNLVMLVSFI